VTGRVDQVDQEVVLLGLDGDVLEVVGVEELGVQGDGGGLDGHTTLLLVGAGIRETRGSSLCGRDNTSTLDKRVGEGGFAVIDYSGVTSAICLSRCDRASLGVLTVGNDGHVTDVRRVVHETTDLSLWLASSPDCCHHSGVAGIECAERTSSTVKLKHC
jgi:hypothetical protein